MNRPSNVAAVLLAAALGLAAEKAEACRGLEFETVTLLNNLSMELDRADAVAKVEIIELLAPPVPAWSAERITSRVKVRVVEAIKGFREH